MSKRVVLPAALRTIRDMKAKDDAQFKGSRFAITCLMSHAHLCNIERGRKQPPEDVIHRLAAHLGVPVDAISYITETEATTEAAA